MPRFTRNDAQAILDSVLKAGSENIESVELTLDSVNDFTDKLNATKVAGEQSAGMSAIYQAVLDGALDYQRSHGALPDASVIAAALNQADVVMDDVVSASGDSKGHSVNAFTPMEPIIAIRSMIATTIPFAFNITPERSTGEGSVVIVSHKAATKTGAYTVGGSLNGMSGGYTYISPERAHSLATSDQTTYKGKITLVQTDFDKCDQSAAVVPLYPNSTRILVNGLLASTTAGTGDAETSSVIVELGGRQYILSTTVNLSTGEVTVKSDAALPTNTDITAVGYLNVESNEFKEHTPSVKVDGKKYPFKAQFYRANVVVTPEAAVQFAQEIGIDPAFEGTFAIRNQFAQETLFSLLHNFVKIGKAINSSSYDFAWSSQGQEKTQATIAEDLIGKIETVSKEMAKKNGSHGVSHIYVGDRLASVIASLGEKYFESSGLTARGGVYRLGRLKGVNAEVYYTPKGIATESGVANSDRMLLIGANASNPAFNPVIMGEVSAPNIEPIGATSKDAEKGYWVTGRRIVAQNPVAQYASSVAIIDCINMAY